MTSATEINPLAIINRWRKLDSKTKNYIIDIAKAINQEILNDIEWNQHKSSLTHCKSLIDNIQNIKDGSACLFLKCLEFVEHYFHDKSRNDKMTLQMRNIKYRTRRNFEMKLRRLLEKLRLFKQVTFFLNKPRKDYMERIPTIIAKIKKLDQFVYLSQMIDNIKNFNLNSFMDHWLQISEEDRNIIRRILIQINSHAQENNISIEKRYYPIQSLHLNVYTLNDLNKFQTNHFLQGFEFTMAFIIDIKSEYSDLMSRIDLHENKKMEEFISIPYFTSCDVPKIFYSVLEYLSSGNIEYLHTIKPNFWCLFLGSSDGNIVRRVKKDESTIRIDNRWNKENDNILINDNDLQLR